MKGNSHVLSNGLFHYRAGAILGIACVSTDAIAYRGVRANTVAFPLAGDRERIGPRRRNGLMSFVVRGRGNDPIVGIFGKPSFDFRN